MTTTVTPEEIDKLSKSNDQDLIEIMRRSTLLSETEVHTLLFASLLITTLEQMMEYVTVKNLTDGMRSEFMRPDLFHFIFGKLSFTDKVSVFEESVRHHPTFKARYREIIAFCRTINSQVRNKVFHNRIAEADYKGNKLTALTTRQRLTADLVEILRSSSV